MSSDGDSPVDGGGGGGGGGGRRGGGYGGGGGGNGAGGTRKDVSERLGGGNYEGPVDENFSKFLRSLVKERDALDVEQFPSIYRLIQAELDRAARGSYGAMAQEPVLIDLYNDPPITLTAKAMPPSRLFPKFNYAGRIIGPKGAYLKALMKETSAKMVLLGKGVMKDKEKEEELRRGNDPKYLHLNEDMHVSIQVTATAPEAYKRMAYALSCLKEQVLSDNRTLESLPWIIGTSARGIPPGGGDRGGHYSQPQRSYPPVESVPRSHRSSAPPQQAYDYGDPSSPPSQYRRYPHEMSPPPPPRKSAPSYGDGAGQWRSATDYPVERRGSHSHMRSRSPPPPHSQARSYSSSAAYEDPYAAYYSSVDSYYPPMNDNGSYGSMPRGGGKMQGARYAPYKK